MHKQSYVFADDQEPPSEEKKQTRCSRCPKPIRIIWSYILRPLFLIFLLYCFICSLDLLSSAFRLLSAKATGALSDRTLLQNPLAGLVIGILLTVLVQSSSTSTSIIITMVSTRLIRISQATYMIMGANIGTSVTNTLVSMGHINNRDEIRKAFAGATVHDFFNWLSVLCLLPLELVSEMLERLTHLIVDSMNLTQNKAANRDLLKTITKPVTKLIIQLNKKVLTNPEKVAKSETIMKIGCLKENVTLADIRDNATCHYRFLFSNVIGYWSDPVVGGVLLIISLVLLMGCLIGVVKLLNSLMQGQVAKVLRRFVNSNGLGPFTGYVAILLGALITILVQSSSVFTSTLTPLVGNGFLELERMYPLTLGSNIGTCVTGILAALASDRNTLDDSLSAALIHLFFNITGIIIWYPIPFMRQIPIRCAKLLGKTASRYRWFPVIYIICMFLLFPLVVFGLSVAHDFAAIAFVSFVVLVVLVIAIIKIIQRRRPQCLPPTLRTWKWLPRMLRSLEPYDSFCRRCQCCKKNEESTGDNGEKTYDNNAFDDVEVGSTRF